MTLEGRLVLVVEGPSPDEDHIIVERAGRSVLECPQDGLTAGVASEVVREAET